MQLQGTLQPAAQTLRPAGMARVIPAVAVGTVTLLAVDLYYRWAKRSHWEQQAEQAAKRAAQLKRLAALPEHLRLGVREAPL